MKRKQLSLSRGKAVMLLVAAAVMWSSAGILIKLVPWHPLAIAGVRSAIAVAVFLIIIKKPVWNGSYEQLGAAVAYAVTVITLVMATKMTTAANAIVLQYTAPVYVALFSAWFLKERTTPADWLTVFFVMGGIILFFLDELTTGNMIGNIYGILSGISFGAFALLLRKQKDGSPLESVLLGNLLAFLVSIFTVIRQPPLEASGWAALIALGVFQLGVPYALYCIAIKYVSALDAVLIPVIEPLLNPLWVFIFLAEVPGPRALYGGIIVLCAVTVRCLLPVLTGKTGNSAVKKRKV